MGKEDKMRHVHSLLDFKRAFKNAQDLHIHVINNGTPQEKSERMNLHHQSGNYSLIEKYNKMNKPQAG